jgi:hypothetical protein
MAGRIFFRILFALVLIAGVGALGVYVYNSGVAQGLAASGSLAPPEGSMPAAPYAYAAPYFYRPWGPGFGFFGLVIPILFGIFLVSALARLLFFRSWHAHGMHGWHGRWRGADGEQVPPMVAEWHRKLHEEPPAPESK